MEKQKIIRKTQDFENAVQDMQKAMDATHEELPEQINKVTEFKKKFPDAIYLEPITRIPTQGVKHPEFEKQREYLCEYVVGMLESRDIIGEIKFYLAKIPGDDYCQWRVPFNKAVGVPRFVAQHLQKAGSWKEMKPLGRDNPPQEHYEENMMTPFNKFETKKRFHFHPINSYG